MLKSMRIEPKPQPPAAFSALTMVSDCVFLGSVETSVFHGFGASKSCPPTVVVVPPVVVVVGGRDVEDEEDVEVLELDEEVGRDVDVLLDVELVVGREVEVDVEVELVVGFDVDVELLDEELELDDEELLELVDVELDEDDVEVVVSCVVDELDEVLVVATRVDEVVGMRVVLVVDVVVVVGFFFRAVVVVVPPHRHALQPRPSAQSAADSHSSPAATSTMPSPQDDLGASKCRRRVARALNDPDSTSHAPPSTFAFSRTLRSVPHAAQCARSVLFPP
jgi:hypothetical protein